MFTGKKGFILFLTLFLFIIGGFLYLISTKKDIIIKTDDNSPTLTITPTAYKDQNSFESKYKSTWIIVRDLDKISLHSNLDKNYTSTEAKETFKCANLVSAGFYDEEGSHIGLFISDDNEISPSEKNVTFNGYFSIFLERAKITLTAPETPRLAVQSGPVLVYDKFPRKINLENDKNSRRVVVATTREGHVVFISIYDKANPLSGPTLAELPEIIQNIDQNTALRIDYALNLDGGTHSVFLSDIVKLTELANAGGFFCIKP